MIPSGSMPFSHHVDTNKDDIEEHAIDVEGELDDDDEGAKEKSPAENQIYSQHVWRELFKTSVGRDKAFVIQFNFSAGTWKD